MRPSLPATGGGEIRRVALGLGERRSGGRACVALGGGGAEEVGQSGRGAVASGAERVGRRRKEMEREETNMWGPLTAH